MPFTFLESRWSHQLITKVSQAIRTNSGSPTCQQAPGDCHTLMPLHSAASLSPPCSHINLLPAVNSKPHPYNQPPSHTCTITPLVDDAPEPICSAIVHGSGHRVMEVLCLHVDCPSSPRRITALHQEQLCLSQLAVSLVPRVPRGSQ